MESYEKMFCVFVFVVFAMFVPRVNLMHIPCDEVYDMEDGYYSANCSSRALGHIPFDLHHNIKVLDLQNNQLLELVSSSFAKYDTLTELYLQNNSIRIIKANAFSLLGQLQVLDLSSNQLTSVPTAAFDGLTSLRKLSLRGNRISMIQPEAFSPLVNLRDLLLDGNYLQRVADEAFKNLDYLENLELQHNNLEFMNENVVQYFTHRFTSFKLYSNPWVCDCKTRWLEDYLIHQSTNQSEDNILQWIFPEGQPVCQGPTDLWSRAFSSLTETDFVCQITMYTSGQEVVLEAGGQTQMLCKYMSNPHVDPVWTRNEEILNPADTEKYVIVTEGSTIVTSILTVKDFQKKNIGEYKCSAENARGPVAISFMVTLNGIDPIAYTLPVSELTNQSPENSHTVTIALSVIGGFIFLLLTSGLIIFAIVKCRRNQRKKSEQRSMRFKEHLKTNVLNHSEIMECKDYEKSDISMATELQERGPYDREPIYDPHPLYDQVPVGSNLDQAENNTYVSFKSEYVEPDEMTQLYTGVNRTKGSDGSQCESTSPLLDNCSPIMCDSHDLLYETSTGSSIYTPAFFPKSHTLNSRYLPSMSSYDTYLSFTPYSTMSHCSQQNTSTPPLNPSVRSKSASANNIGPVMPPKKPPRVFNSRDSMSLSITSSSGSETIPKLSLPKPGTVDEFGTAV
ncbi:leucine-rich repeat-containing protein 24-like [Mizuhopecten yessoensis]|uniref:leucine-rich repeat-containing protein 24-like n=1 Tax=Mizuhopecten yessoensis TaxID=6573 RepID=UPI000B45A1F6|nr:leucine-rich repeat-containing protein 24-like [Mizuhopecten yessoensis]XP_021339054.1 leucine-rich repeat-containing protein 24-like [Mizuhopecten yessoensis]XP_021339056.1 leucine-rich repeat-containing protein 24-like [Mizuhopecten yessoensis]XP_021339057.1 leucine-rich repeat-containing protein 24-like [Mizuhopecten yessoensis]XP_021339058.1 leucine-rich repeat-containing protein 24-like [Mizuhopecten yessoensis]XP_021339059.1 leucine-rich repeat-containing protein 24-like [Mizuhopecten